MNRSLSIGLCTVLLISALPGVSLAQKPAVVPPQQRPRGGNQAMPLRDASNAPKQPAPERGNTDADRAKRLQQQRKRTADAIVDRYVGGFQSNVGLSDEQTQKLSVLLGRYVRQRLMLAERRAELGKQLREMIDRQAAEDQIQAQTDQIAVADKQKVNIENAFYNGINPQLTAVQRGKLKIYIEDTDQAILQAIQKSTQ